MASSLELKITRGCANEFWTMRVQICLSASRQPPAIISKGWDRHSLGYLKAQVEYLCSKLIRTFTGNLELQGACFSLRLASSDESVFTIQTGWIWTAGASLCQPPEWDGDQPQPGGGGAHAGRPELRGHVPGGHPGHRPGWAEWRPGRTTMLLFYHLSSDTKTIQQFSILTMTQSLNK